jgi:hypothetical protein
LLSYFYDGTVNVYRHLYFYLALQSHPLPRGQTLGEKGSVLLLYNMSDNFFKIHQEPLNMAPNGQEKEVLAIYCGLLLNEGRFHWIWLARNWMMKWQWPHFGGRVIETWKGNFWMSQFISNCTHPRLLCCDWL